MQKGLKITPIRALQDNYIWATFHTELKQCVIIDPGEATPVLKYLKEHQMELTAILITHKHHDHTGGILELKSHFPSLEVYGSTLEAIPGKTKGLHEGDSFSLLNNEFRCTVYEVPGHTLGHLAYYVPPIDKGPAVFTGDTLFSGGCGRLFEGTFSQLYDSLLKLRALSKTTQIYCGHEYTVANLKFAHWLEPDNSKVQSALENAQARAVKAEPTLPSTLEVECSINPFLRCDQPDFITTMQQRFGLDQTLTPLALFKYLRTQKDHWNNKDVTN